jgi:hypothetical protein
MRQKFNSFYIQPLYEKPHFWRYSSFFFNTLEVITIIDIPAMPAIAAIISSVGKRLGGGRGEDPGGGSEVGGNSEIEERSIVAASVKFMQVNKIANKTHT